MESGDKNPSSGCNRVVKDKSEGGLHLTRLFHFGYNQNEIVYTYFLEGNYVTKTT